MAREADLIIKGQTDLATARAAMEKFFADFESRELKIKVGSGGGTPGNPATFNNAGGTPWSGATASDRLDSTSRAVSTGASLAMQNGRPGAMPGGLFNTAQDRLDSTAGPTGGEYPTAAAGGVLRTWSAGLPNLPARGAVPSEIPTTRLDRLQNRLADEQRAAFEYRGTEYESAYIYQADQTEGQLAIASGLASRPRFGRGASRKMASALGPMSGAGPASLDDIESLGSEVSPEKAAYLDLVSGRSSGGGSQPQSIRRMLSRYAALGFGAYAAGAVGNAISEVGSIGYNPSGLSGSERDRNKIAEYAAVQKMYEGLPVVGGAFGAANSLVGQTANYFRGNGFITNSQILERQVTLSDIGQQTGAVESQNNSLSQAYASYNNPLRRAYERQAAQEQVQYGVYSQAALVDPKSASGLNSTGERALAAGTRVLEIKNKAEDDQLDFESGRGKENAGFNAGSAAYQASGQNLSADINRIRTAGYDARARLDKSDKNYAQNAATAAQEESNRETVAFGQFINSNTASGIQGIGAARASSLAMSGYQSQAMREQANSQYAAGMVGFDWGSQDQTPEGAASRSAAMLRYQGMYGQYQAGQRQATIYDRKQISGAMGSARAANYALSDRPLDAQIEGINSDEATEEIGVTNPIKLGLMRGQRDLNIRGAKRDFANQRKLVDIGQKYSGRALERSLAMDEVGAEAAGIAGNAISEGNRLKFGGLDAEAEEARRQGMGQVDLLSQKYRLAFRGEQIDLRSMAINNPRDVQDPNSVFAQLARNKADIHDASFGTDQAGGKPLSKADFDAGINVLKSVFAALMPT